jgi:BNR/Asp-box repeat protein
MMRVKLRAAAVALAAVPLAVGTGTASAHSGPALVQASAGDPTASCTAGAESGTNAPNTEVEPYISVNPLNPKQAIGVFQQDRWNNGGAHAGGEVWTRDGGEHWTEGLLPFGDCGAPGGTNYERVSDLWVSFGPDGTAYAAGLEVDFGDNRSGIATATSFNGGRTWKFPTSVINDDDPAVLNDKNSVTADPRHPGTAYAVWDRIDQPVDANGNPTSFDGPGYISVTHDFGRTWSTPAVMVDTTLVPNSQTIGNIIVGDPRTGLLYDFFDSITYSDPTASVATDAHYAFVTSRDEGKTWSAPTRISNDTSTADADPNAPNDPTKQLRTGSGLPMVAIDPVTGELYLTREGTDGTNGQLDQVELQHSTDGGRTWSAPAVISHGANQPSYTPAVAVDPSGAVSLVYYDVSDLQPGNVTTLPTSTWLYTFPRGQQQKATERRIAPDFDWLLAPDAGGHFLGDYDGIAASGFDGARPFFSATINAPQTNEYTGLFEAPWGDPVSSTNTASGGVSTNTVSTNTAADSTVSGTSIGPSGTAAVVREHTLERKTSH